MRKVWLACNFEDGIIAVCRTKEKAKTILWDSLRKEGIPQDELDMIRHTLETEDFIDGYGDVTSMDYYDE